MIDEYLRVREYTVSLCKPLQVEDHVVQPSPDVSPPKWHLAHTTWFIEEMILAVYKTDYKRFHPDFAFLFNSYYNTLGDRVLRPERGNMSRPGVEEILNYRHHVDQQMIELIPIANEAVLSLVEVALHHEQQHQELLLTDIKYILGHNPIFPKYDENFRETLTIESDRKFLSIQGGLVSIGHTGNGFSFDNELPAHQYFLVPFDISTTLVTNREYLEFIQAGGYEDPMHWYSDAWSWLQENKISAPLYWHKTKDEWKRFSLRGLESLPLDEPVTHVSHYEAAAYAEWRGMRLPTEFEWEAASGQFRWGQRWEHTASAYLPYPGYKKPAGALGEYNGKFMINQMVLRGCSVATPEGHSRHTYRNFFPPNVRWQFFGIRLCKK